MKRTTALRLLVLVLLIAAPAKAQEEQPPSPAVPADEADTVAIVLGEALVGGGQPSSLLGPILGRLLDDYAREHNLAATEGEIDAFVEASLRNQREMQSQFEARAAALRERLAEPELPDEERARVEEDLTRTDRMVASIREELSREPDAELTAERRSVAVEFVRRFKINRALYEEYGGRVAFQQVGPEPIDAFRALLEQRERDGAFEILDPRRSEDFWRYVRDDSPHQFFPEEHARQAVTTPWWLMEEPLE